MSRRIIQVGDIFELAAPGANVDISGAQVVVSDTFPTTGSAPVRLRVRADFENDTTFKAIIQRTGKTDATALLRNGDNLLGDSIHEYTFPVTRDETIDFQIGTDGAVRFLTVWLFEEGAD